VILVHDVDLHLADLARAARESALHVAEAVPFRRLAA
jgi:hypothetical protein